MARRFVAASSQYLDAPSAVAGPPLTLGLRVRPMPSAVYQCAMSVVISGASDRIELRIRADLGTIEAVVLDVPSGVRGLAGGSYTVGREYSLVLTQSGPLSTFYINGVSVATNSTAWAPGTLDRVSVSSDVVSGTRANYADMDAYDAFISPFAWTTSDVMEFAAGAAPNTIRPCAGYWPLDGRTTPEPNLAGRVPLVVVGAMPSAFGQYRKRPPIIQADAGIIGAPVSPRVKPVIVTQAVQRAANW